MRRNTYKIALGGLLSSGAVAIMFLGSIMPFATFVSPAVASICVLYFCLEYSKSTAFLVYAVISLLSLLLAPDKEQAMIFVALLGYYPIAKSLFEKLCSKVLVWTLKLVLCNAAMLTLYYVITKVFVMQAVREELQEYTLAILIVLVALGNITFIIYDTAITRMSIYYLVKIKPKLMKNR